MIMKQRFAELMNSSITRKVLGFSKAVMLVFLLSLARGGGMAATAPQAKIVPGPPIDAEMYDPAAALGSMEEAWLIESGYVQEEYFMSGTANIYAAGTTGTPKIQTPAVSYATRLVVLRPADAQRFSGIVVLNPQHPAWGKGIMQPIMDYIIRSGHAFVAVMVGTDENNRSGARATQEARGGKIKPVTTTADGVLKWWSPTRYKVIEWPEDDGIRWDVWAQAAAAVRSGKVLHGLPVRHVFGEGASATATFLRTYINEGFHNLWRTSTGRPLIDGYVIMVSASFAGAGFMPINSKSPNRPPEDPLRVTRAIDVPVIELLSEAEARQNIGGKQAPDSDGPDGFHRLYEMPGILHNLGRSDWDPPQVGLVDQVPSRPPFFGASAGADGGGPSSCSYLGSDVPMRHYSNAALNNIERWLTTGDAPPHAPRIEMDVATKLGVKDEYGSSSGGLRAVQLEVPLYAYGAPTDGNCGGATAMRRIPLPQSTFKKLYPGGRQDYLKQFKAKLNEYVTKRWLLVADAQKELADARRNADLIFGAK
jgi:hypothetical protein